MNDEIYEVKQDEVEIKRVDPAFFGVEIKLTVNFINKLNYMNAETYEVKRVKSKRYEVEIKRVDPALFGGFEA